MYTPTKEVTADIDAYFNSYWDNTDPADVSSVEQRADTIKHSVEHFQRECGSYVPEETLYWHAKKTCYVHFPADEYFRRRVNYALNLILH